MILSCIYKDRNIQNMYYLLYLLRKEFLNEFSLMVRIFSNKYIV